MMWVSTLCLPWYNSAGCHRGSLACVKDLSVPWGEWEETAILRCGGSWTGVNSSCDLSRGAFLMNIHPQTVTCQQGPKNHFQYNPDLSFTLKDSTASASLSDWWHKNTTLSSAHLFICTCPAWRLKSRNSPPSTNLTNLYQTRECTHACSDPPRLFRAI